MALLQMRLEQKTAVCADFAKALHKTKAEFGRRQVRGSTPGVASLSKPLWLPTARWLNATLRHRGPQPMWPSSPLTYRLTLLFLLVDRPPAACRVRAGCSVRARTRSSTC